MRVFAASNSNAKMVHQRIISAADVILSSDPVEYELEGKRMLSTSREALKRIFYLSYAYVTTDDMQYARRAESEMLAISEFKDWNPAHFLDVAEMTLAMAIGYDWLYDYLPVHSRSRIGMAIYEKGIKVAEAMSDEWCFTTDSNWNQVCNAGVVFGALAIYERDKELCDRMISQAVESNKKALERYQPHGVYPEGFGYWEYGTSFQVMMAAALQSSLGEHGGIASSQGFMQSAHWMNFMIAPSGDCFNFYDSHLEASCIPAKYWFAKQLNDTSLISIDERLLSTKGVSSDRMLPLYMIWASGLDLSVQTLPKSKVWVSGGHTPMYIYRSGWQSSDDTYFAIKGGRAADSHGHIDAGSFVYESKGVRWAIDLGVQDYNTLEQAGVDLWNMGQQSSRWDLFRTGADSHNILTINSSRPDVNARGVITASGSNSVSLNLSALYASQAKSVTRSVEIDKKGSLIFTDIIKAEGGQLNVEWKMATRAVATIIGPNVIELSQDGQTIYLKLRCKGKTTPMIWDSHTFKSYEVQDTDVKMVGFDIEAKNGHEITIEVSVGNLRSNFLKKIQNKLGGDK